MARPASDARLIPTAAEQRGILWKKDPMHAQFIRNSTGVLPRRSTKCHERKIARVVALHDRDLTDRFGHFGVGNFQPTKRELYQPFFFMTVFD